MKKIITFTVLAFSSWAYSQQSTGDVIGAVVENNETKAPVVDARVFIIDNGSGSVYNAKTDLDGRFRITAIPTGNYILNILYMGDTMTNIDVNVPIDSYANLGDIKFNGGVLNVLSTTVVAEDETRIRLINGDLPVPELNAKTIGESALRSNIGKLVASMSPEIKISEDGELVFRGARKGDMIYYMDGVKTTALYPIPSAAIARLKAYTGGLPAKYGDTLGGVIVMETKSYFDLYREWYGEELKAGRIQ